LSLCGEKKAQERIAFTLKTGSHRQYRHETKPGTVTVPGHPGDDVPPGTLNSIKKQAGLK
jgi:predicted RNA binding protein YcfA (HicA-like mRNA interferase family)